MSRRLPTGLASLPKVTATPYRIKKNDRGQHVVWKFFGWGKGGWCRLDAYRTHDEAWRYIEGRYWPIEEEPKPQPIVVMATYIGWIDWGGI